MVTRPERGFAIHPQDLTPREEADSAAAARQIMAANGPRFVAFIAACLLLLWPLDFIFANDDARVLSLLAWWRGSLLAFLLAGLAVARRTGAIHRRPDTLCAVAIIVSFVITGFAMGRLGNLDGPWFYSLLGTPLFTIPLLMRLRDRVLTNVALLAGSLGSYLVARPAGLDYLLQSPLVSSYLVAGGMSAVLCGHLLYLFFRANTTARSRLAASEARLRSLSTQLERRVEERTAQLKDALQAMESVRAHERRWVVRELHDALGQELTGLRYGLELLQRRVGSAAGPNAFEPLVELLRRASGTARRILAGLDSAPATTAELSEALGSMVQEAEQAAGLRATAHLEPAELGAISEQARLTVYRVAQEAITNVLKHAAARRLDVSLTPAGGWVVLRVADDGAGIPEPLPTTGLGLGGIRQRVAELGGQVAWHRLPTGGTVMEAKVPATPSADQN